MEKNNTNKWPIKSSGTNDQNSSKKQQLNICHLLSILFCINQQISEYQNEKRIFQLKNALRFQISRNKSDITQSAGSVTWNCHGNTDI